jgi:hypothetical protein
MPVLLVSLQTSRHIESIVYGQTGILTLIRTHLVAVLKVMGKFDSV